MRVIATIEEPEVVRKILQQLGLPNEVPRPLPARLPPAQAEFAFSEESGLLEPDPFRFDPAPQSPASE